MSNIRGVLSTVTRWIAVRAFVLVNDTQHGNVAAAAGVAMLKEFRRDGFYRVLNSASADLRAELEKRLAIRKMPAIITGLVSLWHIVFADYPPVNHADMMRSDMARARSFDAELIRQGVLVLPGVRRLMTAAHDSEAVEATLAAMDRALARTRAF